MKASQHAATSLVIGKKVHGQVSQYQFVYYSVKVQERLCLVVSVKAVAGDPDVFVSNEVRRVEPFALGLYAQLVAALDSMASGNVVKHERSTKPY